MMKPLFFIILTIMLLPSAHGLAISPGRTTLNYEGGPMVGSFTITADKDSTIHISVIGPLAQYTMLEETEVTMSANEMREIPYTIQLQETLSTENLESQIIAEDITDQHLQDGTFIFTKIAVATKIAVQLVVPVGIVEKVLQTTEGILHVQSIFPQELTLGEFTNVDLEFINSGEIPLENVVAEFVVYDNQGNEIVHQRSGVYVVPGKAKTKARIGFDTSALSPGNYDAKVIVRAGARVIEKEIKFTMKEAAPKVREGEVPKQAMTIALLIILGIVMLFSIIMLLKRRKTQPRML